MFVNNSPIYSNNKISKVTVNVEQINHIQLKCSKDFMFLQIEKKF